MAAHPRALYHVCNDGREVVLSSLVQIMPIPKVLVATKRNLSISPLPSLAVQMPPRNGVHAWTPNSNFADSNDLQQATAGVRPIASKPTPTAGKAAAIRHGEGRVKLIVDTKQRRLSHTQTKHKLMAI